MSRSRVLCVHSDRLLASARAARRSAERARVASVTRRTVREDAVVGLDAGGPLLSFLVNGFIDGEPAHARYMDGQLFWSAEVATRAEVVVAMGETFDPGDGGPEVLASLASTPTAALLTVMRAFSQVSSVELGLGPADHDD
ncbi:MAG TPA: hypothetical protein VH479_09915 [Acidimicrobiales bacterium]